MKILNLKPGTLEKVAEGSIQIIPNRGKDALDLNDLNTALQNQAQRKNLKVMINYSLTEDKYNFKIYKEK